MKRNVVIMRIGAMIALAGGLLLFAACPNPLEKEPEPIRYTVSFSVGTGEGTAPANQTVKAGEIISLPDQGNMKAPNDETTFIGWKTGTQTYAPGTSFTVTGDTAFVAQWTSVNATFYTVKFNAGEGTGTPPTSQTVASGTTITLPYQGSMTAPDSKTFMGWSSNQNYYEIYGPGTSFIVNGDITFVAQWGSFSATSYTVSFSTGEGTGTAPTSQTVAPGTTITLPEQGAMTAPGGKTFNGWITGDRAYAAGASFTVTANTGFTAQWKIEIDSNKTYVEFENPEEFPVIIYSDSSRLTELVRVPAKGTQQIETEPKPQGTVFYPQFLLEFEGIPLSYEGAVIMLRVDEKKVNRASIPKLNSIQTGSAFIKIENNSASSLTFVKGSLELATLGTSSTIIMPAESARYRIEPGPASQYSFMRNGSIPLVFPSQVTQFEAEMLYMFAYNGTALTLSNAQSVLQALSMLPAPASVNVSMTPASGLSLTWASVENATSYKVYRSSVLNGDYEFLASASASPYTGNETLNPGTSYYYKVQALNADRESLLSAPAAILILPAVQGLTAQVPDAASISLSWSAVSGASEYTVYRSSGSNAEYQLLNTAGDLSYIDASASAGTEYTYRIQAVDTETFGASPFAEISARILAAPQLNAQMESATSISLTWEPVEGATTYKLYRAGSPDTDFTLIQTLSEQTHTDQGLSQGSYYYKVQGTNSQGDGVLSAAVPVMILPAPQGLQAQAAEAAANITVSWAAVTGASSYQVYRSTSSDTGFAIVGTPTALSYTDRNLDEGTTYYYKVRALNTATSGESPLSARASARTPVLMAITNIAYSSVSGSTGWTLESDGRRKSPAISSGGVTKSRVSFTSSRANTSITIQLDVSSESGCDYAFISQLDNASATYSNGYYSGSRIAGTGVVMITIPVPTMGDHFIDIGYQKDISGSSGSDCAWFTVVDYTRTAYTAWAGSGPAPAISNIAYSSVPGSGTWTLQSDGKRKSPAISNGRVTKSRISFTSHTANTSITIQLDVSSESGCDYAFISQLDNASATYSSGYYSGSRIAGTGAVMITIPVPTMGDHFIDIGYQKDISGSSGSDCAWFTVVDYTGDWAESSASIQIDLQPIAASPTLSNASLFANESAQFSAGSGYASYQWYWDGVVIDGATSNSYNLPADSKDPGVYELLVIVTTSVGQRLSARCRVTIKAH